MFVSAHGIGASAPTLWMLLAFVVVAAALAGRWLARLEARSVAATAPGVRPAPHGAVARPAEARRAA